MLGEYIIININGKKIAIIIFCCLITINFVSIASSININHGSKNIKVTSTSIAWDATINFEETGGKIDSVIFGEADDANDGPPVDSYDVQKPPVSPTPYVRAWFDDGFSGPYIQLLRDYRSYPDTYKVWNLTVQWVPTDYTSPTDLTISWSIPEISDSEYDSILMNGIDMFSQSTHSFTASAVVPYEFEIICSILPNDPPQFSNEAPSDGADEQSISLSALSIYIQDSEDDDFDWSIETSPDVGSNSGTGASDGFKTCSISGLSYSTTYNWYVNATDPLGSNTYTREVYTFTTEDEQINQAPTPPNSPSPSDDTTNVGINPTISVYVQDPDEDQMTVRFYNQEDDLIGTDTNEPSGTRAGVPWTGLEYNTDYYWYAVADDGEYTTKGPVSGYWHFKTRQEPQENEPPELPTNPLPEDDATDVDTSPSLSVFVDDPNNDVLTVVFYNASDDSIIGTDEDVPSGSTAEITWQDLGYNITYSWYAISNDDEHDVQSETWQFTTETKQNQPPTINLLKPEEGAIYFSNLRIINFPTTVIIGKIDIQATATDDVEVQKIELLIDGEKIEEQNSDVFEYLWNERSFGRHDIKVIAYDDQGASSSKTLNVLKIF